MCGRFNLLASGQALIGHFKLTRLPHYQPAYNIPPGRKILTIVALEDGSRKGVNLHWGLIPSWSKDASISSHLINARAETVAEKPSFRVAYQHRRCLIPATGFYEWQQLEAGKQAYHVHYPDNRVFAFAGLWEYWQGGQETVYSCAIITTAADAVMMPIHARMPIIIAPEDYPVWLDSSNSTPDITGFEQAPAYHDMQLTPIGNRINNPVHNDAACLHPLRP
ncbi:MAG: hypothetical protein CVV13_10320 [Gammaproteobacteria bacterium HGW-Gammaproteobacteria-3]|nr:MAG: hypothetical protein CVV13_10320 [Gammaproteobacteria bacterium HGW-Gammaproteobacteria-3]